MLFFYFHYLIGKNSSCESYSRYDLNNDYNYAPPTNNEKKEEGMGREQRREEKREK